MPILNKVKQGCEIGNIDRDVYSLSGGRAIIWTTDKEIRTWRRCRHQIQSGVRAICQLRCREIVLNCPGRICTWVVNPGGDARIDRRIEHIDKQPVVWLLAD